MKTLIAIGGCEVYEVNGLQQPMRDTWLKDAVALGFDYKFFHGYGGIPREDVVIVDCDDGYHDVTKKTIGKLKWALSQDYDFVFCCFPDTYACAERLVKCGYESFDYLGDLLYHINGEYCQGGSGFFLSRLAVELIVRTPVPSYRPNDDTFIGEVLRRDPSMKRGDSRYFNWIGIHPTNGPLKTNDVVTCHLSQDTPNGYEAKYMYQKHDLWCYSMGYPIVERVSTVPKTVIDSMAFPAPAVDNSVPRRALRGRQ